MSATMVGTTSRARKTLADQIDRLDQVLDGLAENLQEAVALAVKAAVREAAEAAVKEVLARPELRKCLRPNRAVPTGAAPCLAGQLAQAARGAWAWLAGAARDAWNAGSALFHRKVAEAAVAVRRNAALVTRRTREVLKCASMWALALFYLLRQLRVPLLAALAVGLAIGVGCFFAGPLVASLVSGLTSLALTLTALVLRPVWQILVGTALTSAGPVKVAPDR